MLVIFFTEGKNVPASRFRVQQFLPFLRKEGVSFLDFESWPQKYYAPQSKYAVVQLALFAFFIGVKSVTRFFQLFFVPFADVIFIQREIIPYNLVFFERTIHFLNRNIVFDFDDAIFLYKNEIQSGFGTFLTRKDTIGETIAMSRRVICGNGYLSEYAHQYNKNAVVIPTVIDTEKYIPKSGNPSGRNRETITIGWMGTSGNLKYVFKLADVFREIIRKYPQVSLRIVTDTFLFQKELSEILPVEYKKWSSRDEVSDLQSFDIGIMPLPDDQWTRGKCGFKLIQYMSVGVPSVASSVGVNIEIVQDGKNGFLAGSDREWYEKLSLLIEDSGDIRELFRAEGRKRIEAAYSIKSAFPRWIAVIREAAKKN